MKHVQSRIRNSEIVKRGAAGELVEALAAQHSVTAGYVRVLLARSGVKAARRKADDSGHSPTKLRIIRRRVILAEIHSLGVSGGAAIRLTGMQKPVFYKTAKELGLKFPYDKSRWEIGGRTSQKRASQMVELYRAGCTLQQIGNQFGISRERVRQLMTKHHGIRADDGGARVQSDRAIEIRKQKRDQKSWAKHGCSYADYRALVALHKPTRAYISQKRNAVTRGIEWHLNLWQWWTIWQQSGKWAERGRAGDAFVMCRRNDQGPYSSDNVYIATLRHNSTVQPNNRNRKDHPDHHKVVYGARLRSLEERISGAGCHRKNPGLPRGVTQRQGVQSFQAQAQIAGKPTYLGSFPTPEEAHAAYVAAVTADVNNAHKFQQVA